MLLVFNTLLNRLGVYWHTLDHIVLISRPTNNDYLCGTLSWTVATGESELMRTTLSIKRDGSSIWQGLKGLVCEEGTLQVTEVSCYGKQVYCTLGTWQVSSTMSETRAALISRATIVHLQRTVCTAALCHQLYT